jgi:hypothetical protein
MAGTFIYAYALDCNPDLVPEGLRRGAAGNGGEVAPRTKLSIRTLTLTIASAAKPARRSVPRVTYLQC